MSIKIGHASIDERGKSSGGVAGDQTGKEVCIRNWYNNSWKYVLRPKSSSVAEKMAKACEAGCANNNIGYDQNQRNSLHTLAKNNGYNLSTVGKCETDCSAFMTVCAIAAGVIALEYSGNAPTTSTMVNAFKNTGAFDILSDSKYLTSDAYLKRGDILVKPGHHTVMALSNGSSVTTNTVVSKPATSNKLSVDGEIGRGTVKVFQKVLGTPPDGCISGQPSGSKKYWTAICASACGWTGGKSQFVVALQKMVGTTADGLLGKGTAKALQMFLTNKGYACTADGYFGTNSAKALQRWLNSKI